MRHLATESRKRRLTIDDLERLGRAMRDAATEEEHPVGLGAIRVMLLTGFRRMEVLGLQRAWRSRRDHCIRFPDTKSGAQVRVIGSSVLDAIERVPQHLGSRPVRSAPSSSRSSSLIGKRIRKPKASSATHS